jgi:membrane-bound serine protease (ClpP class)
MARFLFGLIAATCLAIAPDSLAAQGVVSSHSAVILTLDGAIGPAAAEYVHDGFSQARRRQAAAVVLQLDTPGGLSSSMRDIIRDILDSPIPVIAYVAPRGARAASAGTYILYATHFAAMAPSTHIGAATPVQLGGGLFGGEKKDEKQTAKTPEETKVLNDAVAYIRSLAQLRGRNAEWAEKAVRDAATLTDTEAKEQHVVELIADDITDLLKQADGRTIKIGGREVTLKTSGLKVVPVAPDWRARILAIITDPTIAYLLFLGGLYGLLFEFLSPGAYFPGVLGSISLLIGLYALNLLPVNYAGAGLLLLGIGMLIAEGFLPTFGVVGIGGIAAFVLGSLLLFRGDAPGFQLAWQAVAAAAAASVAILMLALAAVWRAHKRDVVIGDGAMLADAGEVMNWNGGQGIVQVRGERWHAVSGTELHPGQRVRIVERRNLTLAVEPEKSVSTKD